MTLRKLLPLLLVCCSFVTAYAQKETQYIYLFDCTTSMKGYNGAPDIIGDAKKCLKEDIEQKTDHCDILFIPFQGNQPLQTLAFRRNQFKWDEVEARIDEVIDNPTNTDIVSAWDRAVKAFNPHAQNVLYLYTDGIDNVHGAAAVADMIRKWCVSAPDNVQAVYYMLTKASQNPEIEAAIKECTHIRVAKGLNDNPVVTTPGIVWRFDTGMDTVRAELDFTYRHSFAAKAQEIVDENTKTSSGFAIAENGSITFSFTMQAFRSRNYLVVLNLNSILANLSCPLFGWLYDMIFAQVPVAASVVQPPKDPPLPPANK